MLTLSHKKRETFTITKNVKSRSFAFAWGDFRLEKAQSRRLFLKMSDIFQKCLTFSSKHPGFSGKSNGIFPRKQA